MKDFQRQRVYAWENEFRSGHWFEHRFIQEYVNHVWKEMGLEYPPKVLIQHKNARHAGSANRQHLFFPEKGAHERVILHEIAHAMLSPATEGEHHSHNEYYVGMYMKLLEKFMDFSPFYLWFTAEKKKVKYKRDVKPAIIDGGIFYL